MEYSRFAPSGVYVTSTTPFPERKWWDRPSVHWIWSYASWVSMVLKSKGHPRPRAIFDKYLTR